MYRYDIILSTWIFIWFLLYYFRAISYTPILILVISSFVITFVMLYKIYKKDKYIFAFFIRQCVIKFIPLYLIWSNNIINTTNVISTLIFILLYLCYMYAVLESFEELLTTYDRILITSSSLEKT